MEALAEAVLVPVILPSAGMQEAEDVSRAENPRLCGGSKCWQRNMADSWFSHVCELVIFLCSETAQMSSDGAGNLDSVELCPVSCQKCRKERSYVCTSLALTLLPALGMCLLPLAVMSGASHVCNVFILTAFPWNGKVLFTALFVMGSRDGWGQMCA